MCGDQENKLKRGAHWSFDHMVLEYLEVSVELASFREKTPTRAFGNSIFAITNPPLGHPGDEEMLSEIK